MLFQLWGKSWFSRFPPKKVLNINYWSVLCSKLWRFRGAKIFIFKWNELEYSIKCTSVNATSDRITWRNSFKAFWKKNIIKATRTCDIKCGHLSLVHTTLQICCDLWQTVAFQQGDGKFSTSAALQSTEMVAATCN